MGLLIDVYRSAGSGYDCTNGGVSSKYTKLCVVNVDGPFNPSENAPAVRLESHYPGIVRLVPEGEKGWVMAGGNFGSTSDSRFSEAVEKLIGGRFYGAVAIHDRVE